MNFSDPVVDVRSLHVRFGEVEAVAGIDLQAYAGQACGNVLVLRGGSRVATMDAVDMIGDEGARAYRGLLD